MAKTTKISLKKIAAGTTGSEIAEAALVIPIFFMIMLGIYWFGRALNSYATINHAAREGALMATMSNCASCGNTPVAALTVANTVTAALQASGLDPNQIQAYAPPSPAFCGGATPTCNSANDNITVCSNVQLTPSSFSGSPACGVTVSFQYPYNFSLPFAVPGNGQNTFNLQLKANVQMRGEY
ncbi:MAG: TadE/TadG family type IV pilus assembly protein [Terriglobales bacterium]